MIRTIASGDGTKRMADMLRGGIVINEFLVDPNGVNNFDTDGNGTADNPDEFVELFNTSTSAIDIGGLELWDAGIGNWFTFPPGTTLQPGGHAMVITGVQSGGSLPTGGPDDLFFDAGRGGAVINNGGDNIVLHDPTAGEFVIATFNGDSVDDPTAGGGGYTGFPSGSMQVGSGEDFGNDTDGLSLGRLADGSDDFAVENPTPGTTNICFANGTRIATPDGNTLVEHLRPGDLVTTRDHGPKPVVWVFARRNPLSELLCNPAAHPVLIRKGALGAGLPRHDLRVSRQHRLLVTGKIAKRVAGCDEVLIAAHHLTGLPEIEIETPTSDITYFHVMLARHEVLLAEGAPAESLYLGAQTRHALSGSALAELHRLLGPQLPCFVPARPLAEGQRARQIIRRHHLHARPVLASAA